MNYCPNCGALHNGGPCIHCHWREGEKFFRPWWMPEKEWLVGRQTHWLPRKKKEPDRPLAGAAKVIMEAIRKTGG